MIILPVYNIMLLPHVTIFVQGDSLRKGTEEVPTGEEVIFLLRRRNSTGEELENQFYPQGVMGRVQNLLEDGNVAVQLETRVDIRSIATVDDEVQVEWEAHPDLEDLDPDEVKRRFEALKNSLYQILGPHRWSLTIRGYIADWETLDEGFVYSSAFLGVSCDEKYQIMATDSRRERFGKMEKIFYEYAQVLTVTLEASQEQQERNAQVYRESALRHQIDILQGKLDEMHPDDVSDVNTYGKKIQESGMNETARNEAEKILRRLRAEGPNSHEYGMLTGYLDFITSLSWKKEPFEPVSVKQAREILARDHYGMKKVKDRVIQQLAVMNLNQKHSGSILLFVGAPGTGKTSVGRSIAEALNRKYVRISLGGVRDEADIRGHRRTYIGAMPGRIMDGIRRSGVSNPVVVLDEVDKLSRDYSGDPASALLEVLDPEQNFSFTDHYMNVPYDLSDVLFLCTANRTDTIPEPLLNRMEVVEFSGYTESEKMQIARRHLLPKAMEQTGLKPEMLKLSEKALRTVISDYTAEAGVRNLRRQMDAMPLLL